MNLDRHKREFIAAAHHYVCENSVECRVNASRLPSLMCYGKRHGKDLGWIFMTAGDLSSFLSEDGPNSRQHIDDLCLTVRCSP